MTSVTTNNKDSSYVDLIKIDRSRDVNLTDFGKATLRNRYLLEGEDFQDIFARVAYAYSDNIEHAQRLYDYMSNLWFMPSTPILSNGGTSRGLPISCFLNEVDDSINGIVDTWVENVWLASRGGGIGSYWGNIRSIGEKVSRNGETCGVIPFMKVQDSMTLAISQGSLRRGSAAIYLPVWHPEIEEFIEIRKPTGGDHNRKTLNTHHGVVVSDDFMRAVENDEDWALRSPKDNAILRTVKARDIWIRLLTTRVETGEPYILFIDAVNRAIPEHHKMAGLRVKMSNLCSEITLPTGKDYNDKDRTAVCCLSSVNLEKYKEWENDPLFIEDCMRFLDNVMTDFIDNAPDTMAKAKYSAMMERSVGLGAMGFHSFLQANNIPFEGVMAKVWNTRMFKHIKEKADAASILLAEERGACPDAQRYGIKERFSNKLSIAPTASISIICGGTSPGIEPFTANAYVHKTLSGSFAVRNPHLEKLLEEKGKNTEKVWSDIMINEGSVQHLDFLSDHEKDVFKTAFELDQRWIVQHAGDRQKYICQSQSLNIFLPANVSKKELHQVHMMGWKVGLKSFYYTRSKSIQRAESSGSSELLKGNKKTNAVASNSNNANNYEECLSCQ